MRFLNRRLQIAFLIVLSVFILSSTNVAAHSPSSMTLEYETGTQILTVIVSHSVSDSSTHFVDEIQIQKNGVSYTSRTYTDQDSTTGMSDTFSIDAVAGDVLRVEAFCNIAGSIVRELTVPDDTTSTTTTITDTTTETTSPTTSTAPPPFEMTTLILATVLALGIVAILVAVFRRR